LEAKERLTIKIDAMEYGVLMHYVLEMVFAKKTVDRIFSMSEENLRFLVEDVINVYIREKMGGLQNKTERFRHQIKKSVSTACEVIKFVCEDLRQSGFQVLGRELKISKQGDVPPLEIMADGQTGAVITGKIDRMDIMERRGMKYVRILDYKTGSEEFRLSDVLYGLNLQLFLYMMAVLNTQKNDVKPGGMLYLKVIRPSIDIADPGDKNFSEDLIDEEKSKSLRMDGIILNDEDVVSGMEKDLRGKFIPVRRNKSGEFRSSSLMNSDEIYIIMRYISAKIKNMVRKLSEGKTDVSPISIRRGNGIKVFCDYCPYKTVCGFESDGCRGVKNMAKDDVINKMREENEVNGV
jgi:ATP-dependent helicase/nuclease subunit B